MKRKKYMFNYHLLHGTEPKEKCECTSCIHLKRRKMMKEKYGEKAVRGKLVIIP